MGTSSITITSLTASPTLRGNKLAAAVTASGPAANIPTLMLATVEFFASTTNDFTTATKVIEGNPEALHAGLLEEQTYYYWAKPRAVNGNYGAVYPASPTGGVACTAIGQSGLAFGLANGRLVVDDHSSDPTVASGALRIALKTAALADPSASSPVLIAFRNADSASGGYAIRTITSAVAVTIPNGAYVNKPGLTDPYRIWVLAYDNGTSNPVLAVINTNGQAQLDEASDFAPSVFIGGLGGDDLGGPNVNSHPSTNRYRIIGYCDWNAGPAVPGTWVQPDAVHLFGPGSRRPGDIVQASNPANLTGTSFTGSGVFPFDNTIPQIGEGTFVAGGGFFSRTVSIQNYIRLRFVANVSYSAAAHITAALFRGAEADAIRAAVHYVGAADQMVQVSFDEFSQMKNVTYNVRLGGDVAGTWRVGGTGGARKLGGVMLDYWIEAVEVMG